MRIALVTPEYRGCGPSFGIGRYVEDLASGLANAGHQVLIVAATDIGCFRFEAFAAPMQTAAAHPHLVLRPLAARSWLIRELRAFNPDLIEIPNWGGLGALLPRCWPTVVRLSTSAGDPAFRRHDALRWLRLAWERRTVRRATQVIADSQAMAAMGLQLYGRAAESVILHAYCGSIEPPTARPRPWALYVGRLEQRKGIDLLLAAWPTVRRAIPEAELHIVGRDMDGWERRIPGGIGITYHGFASPERLRDLRLRCRMQVVPSRFESFGLVVLEAWAHGLAVAACRAGGLPEVVGEDGILVPTEDVLGLVHGIGLGLDPATSDALAQRGQQRLRRCFAPGPWIDASLRAYSGARRSGSATSPVP